MLPSPFRDAIYEGHNGKSIEEHYLYAYEWGSRHLSHTLLALNVVTAFGL
ncbi:hypothetical protein [Bartonella grahamii]|nr:hypothetical protein [Bartonella grahamii]